MEKLRQAFFSPGIAFLDCLTFSRKIAVLALCFSIPLTVAISLLWHNISYWENFTRSELTGIQLHGKAWEAFFHLMRNRGLTLLARVDPARAQEYLLSTGKEIETTFRSFDLIHGKYGNEFDPRKKWPAFKGAWEKLSLNPNPTDPVGHFEEQTNLLKDFSGLMEDIGYRFRVLLDPSHEGYFLAETMFKKIPELAESMGALRGSGLMSFLSPPPDPLGLIRPEKILPVSRFLAERLEQWRTWESHVGIGENHGLLMDHLQEIVRESLEFIRMAESQVLPMRHPTLSPGSYFASGTATLASVSRTYGLAHDAMKKLLLKRLTYLHWHKQVTFGVTFVVALFLSYLCASFYSSLNRTVKSLEKIANRLETGELNEVLPIVGRDELGVVVGLFNKVAITLRESEQRYHDFYDNAPYTYFNIGEGGLIRECNRRAGDLLGLAPELIRGRRIFDFFPDTPHGKMKAQKAFQNLFSGNSIFDTEIQVVRTDGRMLWVNLSMSGIRDATSKVIESRAVMADITDRNLAKEQLEWELAMNAALAEIYEPLTTHSGTIEDIGKIILTRAQALTKSPHGYVSAIDPKTEEIIGHALTEMHGDLCHMSHMTASGPFSKGQRGIYPGLWGYCLNTRKPFFTNSPQTHSSARGLPNGHMPLDRFLSHPVLLEGQLVGQISLGNSERDYTERDLEVTHRLGEFYALAIQRKRAEEALTRQRSELERSNAELEQFAYVASHDLQEPLRSVTLHMQLLERRAKSHLDEQSLQSLRFAVDGSNRMRALIQDLLAYARVGRPDVDIAEINLNDLIAEVRKDLEFSIEKNEATLTVDPLPKVRADPSQMRQLFVNLIGNALKFRREEKPEIRVSSSRSGGMLEFRIQDNGIGIEPKYYERIFKIFQRLHDREAYPGTGIGLAVCRRIVERYGGKIRVESEPGKGTTFLFTFPALSGETA